MTLEKLPSESRDFGYFKGGWWILRVKIGIPRSKAF